MRFANRIRLFLVFASVFILALDVTAESPQEIRELWVGTFSQTSPLPWQGKMELYLRYRSGQSDPRPFEGIITWQGLAQVRTSIIGKKSWEDISFTEKDCLSGGCSLVVTGGSYHGKFDDSYSLLTGNASQAEKGLKGTFRLKRVFLPELPD